MTETLSTPTESLTGDYSLDPAHSRLGFAVRHAMVTNVKGHFDSFTGTAHLDVEDPTKSSATVEIDVPSITTGVADRDTHLRTSDFFDAENHPKITFKSTGVEKVDDETYVLRGDLTIKEVTKPVEVTFELTGVGNDPWGNFRAGFEGKATISRKEWGLTYNMALEAGGVVIGDKVKLEIDVAAVKQNAS